VSCVQRAAQIVIVAQERICFVDQQRWRGQFDGAK